MNTDKQAPNPPAYKPQPSYDDEISLVDIYLTIKRNSKLFFVVVLLSFFISLFVTYKYQSNIQKEIVTDSPELITEYTLWIEIGKIFGIKTGRNLIDDPNNTLEKIKRIYIPKVTAELFKSTGKKLNQSSVSVDNPINTQLMVIKVVKTSDNIDYHKILTSLAGYILANHNEGINLTHKNFIIRPTKIIQKPIEIKVKSNKKSKSLILIPMLGIVLGVFLAFIAVFIRVFFFKYPSLRFHNFFARFMS